MGTFVSSLLILPVPQTSLVSISQLISLSYIHRSTVSIWREFYVTLNVYFCRHQVITSIWFFIKHTSQSSLKMSNLAIMKRSDLFMHKITKAHLVFDPGFSWRGSLVIALVRLPVVHGLSVRWSVFEYLRDRSLFFSDFLHEVTAS